MSAPVAPRAPALEQQVEIETPEQVVFAYTVAGIGSRAAAALLDYLLMAVILIGVSVIANIAESLLGVNLTGKGAGAGLGSWATALLLLFAFALQWGYYVVFEAIWDGQTPGKRQLGIRVVQDGGYSVGFGASAVRNLARVLDMQPGFVYAVGILSAAINRSGKRLGDMLAGTIVVQEKMMVIAPVAVPSRAGGEAAPAAVVTAALSDAEYEVLERYLARRAALDPERRRALAERLVEQLAPHLQGEEGSPFARLMRLFERERDARARGVASRGATGAAREQHAIVARGAGRWSAFASRLADAQRRGLRAMREDEVSEFVAAYREVATDLARLRTASAGRDSDALFYVSRLVGAGHNLIYRQRTLSTLNAWRYLTVTVPREVRRSWRPILLAAVLLFGPMTATAVLVVRRPSLAEELLPPSMIDRVEEGVAREKKGQHDYVKVKDLERPIMAGRIIANNVQVTFAAFASGLTAGVLTVLILITNGVSIGAVFGLYASRGIFRQIELFVLPHSVLELSAICIASGGGLLIAAGILLPGARTRREALVVNGRRAIRLLTATTLMLVVAGSLEGLLSPRTDVPEWTKFAAASVTAVLMLFYFTRGGAGEEDAVLEENAYSDARALISR